MARGSNAFSTRSFATTHADLASALPVSDDAPRGLGLGPKRPGRGDRTIVGQQGLGNSTVWCGYL